MFILLITRYARGFFANVSVLAGIVAGADGPAGLRGVAHVDELQQLESAGATDRADDLAGLKRGDRGREGRRNLIAATPAEVSM